MPAPDAPPQRLSRDQSTGLLTLIMTAIVGGRQLLGEPGLLFRLLRQLPLPGAERAPSLSPTSLVARRERPRITGLPPPLEVELRRRARLHGVSFTNYVVAILGQLASRASPADGPTDVDFPRPAKSPDLHLILGGQVDPGGQVFQVQGRRQLLERDIRPIAELPHRGHPPDET